MMDAMKRNLLLAGAASALAGVFGATTRRADAAGKKEETFEVTHTDDEWRALLGPNRYAVLRHDGTERPFSSPLNNQHRAGTFVCAGCKLELFSSRTKFESGTGWPSFWQPLPNAVVERRDSTLGMVRTEVHCRRCGGHLGHVFNDGPRPTGLRYCMNGVSLEFVAGPA
jgi:peptide-methionine (R)-S-oxide reductase